MDYLASTESMNNNPAAIPLSELVETLRNLTPRGMSHHSARSQWFVARQLMANSAQRFASDAKYQIGHWILITRWREHQADMARALGDLAMAKKIAVTIRSSLLEDEDSHFYDLQHLERAICVINELQHHPRFSRLPVSTLDTELQPA